MRMQLSTWDGHSLQDTNYKAITFIGAGNGMSVATPNFIDMGQGDPVLGGKTLAGTLYTFQIQLLGTTDAAVEAQRVALCGWFRPNDFTFRKLVGLDVDNSNKDWYLEGYPISAPTWVEDSVNNMYSITLALKEPYWIENDLNTNTWVITADTETEVMNNVGNVPALATFAITPNNPKISNGILYKKFVAIHGDAWHGYNIPIDLTSAGLDTASLIGSGAMQADGDDLKVSVNGYNRDRGFGGGGINSATTGVWISVPYLLSEATMTLITAFDNSTTPATFQVSYTNNVLKLTSYSNTILQIGTEIITCSSLTNDTINKIATFTTKLRGAKGSTKAAHLAGVAVYAIDNDIMLTYGDPTATAPTATYTPGGIDMTSSTNSSWVFDNFGSGGMFISPSQRYSAGHGSYYTGTHGVPDWSMPYANIGLGLSSYLSGNIIIQENSNPSWEFRHPKGITNFEANGEKYRSATNFGTMTINGINADGSKTVYVTETSPTNPATWEAITIDTACAGSPKTVSFQFQGPLGTTFPVPYSFAELNDVTLTVTPPTITLIAEQANYNLGGSLANSTNSQSILFNNILTKTSETVTINCADQEISCTDGQKIRASISFGGAKRDEWIQLESGNNSIVFTDTGTDQVTIVTTWRARNTI